MITIRFTQPGRKFQGVYAIPHCMLDETLVFLAERGYVVEGR